MGGGAKPPVPQPDAADPGFIGTAMRRATATAVATGRTALARDPRQRLADSGAIATPGTASRTAAAAAAAGRKQRARAGAGDVLGKPGGY